jgi:hypothetical protein
MLSLFKRKKIKEERVANIFVDHFLTTLDNGWPEVAALINESPEFVDCPNISEYDSDKFLLVSLSANLMEMTRQFPPHCDQEVTRRIIDLVSEMGDVDSQDLTRAVQNNQKMIAKVNHPSKNLVYGMSKALFYKYNLNKYQEEYFRNVNSPNPIFLKRLDDAMEHFMWNWEEASRGQAV